MARVADVKRAVDFYKHFGMEVRGSLRNPAGELVWVYIVCDRAELMLTRATGPITSDQQAILFYMYSPDLVSLRDHLVAKGVTVSGITYPEYMPKGEVQVEDLDGYVLLIGQAG